MDLGVKEWMDREWKMFQGYMIERNGKMNFLFTVEDLIPFFSFFLLWINFF